MKKLIIVFFVIFLGGCASSVKGTRNSSFTDALQAFESIKDLPKAPVLETEAVFHSIIYQDNLDIRNSHKLTSKNYDGTKYLIGVEKFGTKVSNNGSLYNGVTQFFDKTLACQTKKNLQKSPNLCDQYDSVTEDPRPAFVSHIAKFQNNKTSFIYNVYGYKNNCSLDEQNGSSCLLAGLQTLAEPIALQRDILATIEKERPTHIIVMSTGWNTYQSESIDNYNEWIHVIEQAAAGSSALGKEFRPLYIGLSWESTWGALYSAGLGFISQPNKSNDADEVGLVTANVLVNTTLKPIIKDKEIKLVLIGHSFGARVMGHAAFSGSLVPGNELSQHIDLFLGLQGAFSYRRFMCSDNDGREGTPYRPSLSNANHVVMTNSDFDAAVKEGFWTDYIGSSDVRTETNKCCENIFVQSSLSANGDLDNPDAIQSNQVVLVNADNVINMNKINTNGGAHSDVFTKEIGRFIWNLINQKKIKKHQLSIL